MPDGVSDEIRKLAELHDDGTLTEDEFANAKAAVLARAAETSAEAPPPPTAAPPDQAVPQQPQPEKKNTSPATWGCLILIIVVALVAVVSMAGGNKKSTTTAVRTPPQSAPPVGLPVPLVVDAGTIPQSTHSSQLQATGKTEPGAGMSYSVNGVAMTAGVEGDGSFNIPIKLKEGQNAIEIKAFKDKMATTTLSYRVTYTRSAEEKMSDPKGDGNWTVGVEMAAGKWRSQGTGSSCYWQRSPDGESSEIIDNHFGDAGGTVTVRSGEEFQTRGCGQWEKVG